MENITLGQINNALLFLTGLIAVTIGLMVYIKKGLKKMLKEDFDEIRNNINNIGISNCKNFLVSCFAKLEQGQALDETELERFYEEYDIYINEYHKNSYIHAKHEKLKEEVKI